MDWASSQWKEGLSSIALQKISALEEKIEKLQKERQQKQHQFDCLELTLNKEKRKVEEEKQQTVRLERELQSLADACKSFESKQQKFLADIQNRDSRINNLESQLSQAKKQNSRLHQLENDIEELRCLKESAKLENRQLEEKLTKEKDIIVKQSDAISGLEQTVRSLQEKCSNTENSVLLNVTDKENVNILNISTKDNLASESLRKKILEQENTIKSLQEELTRISGSKEKLSISINDSFATPSKGKNTLRDTSISSAKKSFSIWDNFGSTPAKSGKLTKHINDSSSFNNESDEKVHSLQLKLKQMCQELECQRHNFEATKNGMEQRFKEKENALKSEVKQQAQTIFDLDKELRELKNKYQQDVVQGSKKLDIVNMQLQKNELSKQQMEKDLKALEIQMNSRNSSLLQKEEELKDVLKLKNSLEASTKSLQSEKRELEKNYSTLISQKNSLSEEIRDLKIQLDGSSNLVKEKESLISNMKKEQSSSLKIKSDLENKINSLNKDLSSLQSEKSVFEKQLQELHAEISVMANNLESVKEEKKNINSVLDLEKSKSEKLKCDLDNKEKELVTLQSEIKSNELNIMSLKTELEQLTSDYNVKIKDMEQKLLKSDEEISHLKHEVQTYSDNKKVIEENITELRKENVRISDLFTSKESECESFRKQTENLESELQSVQNDNATKDENICLLEEKIKSIDEAYDKQLTELKDTICQFKSEKADLETLLKDYKINEESLKAAIAKAETEKQDLSELVAAEKEKNKELDTGFQNLQMELSSKDKELTEVKDTICLLKSEKADLETLLKDYNINEESLKAAIARTETEKHNLSELLSAEEEKNRELDTELSDLKVTLENLQMELNSKDANISLMNGSLCAIKSEKSALENDLKNLADKEKTLENNLIQIETDKQNLLDLLNKEKVKSETLQFSLIELEKKISDQQEEITAKDLSISDLNKHIEELKANIYDMNESLCAIKSENSALENDLKNLADKEKTSENNLIQIETDKQNLLDLLNKEKVNSEALQLSLIELEKKISDQQEELTVKDLSINDLNKHIEELKENMSEMNETVSSIKSETVLLQKNLKACSVSEESLQKKLSQSEKEKQKISELLSGEKEKCRLYEMSVSDLEKKLNNLQTELDAKDSIIVELNKNIDEFKKKTSDIEENLAVFEKEKLCLVKDLEDSIDKGKSLEEKIEKLETEKQEFIHLFKEAKKESDNFQSNLEKSKEEIDNFQTELNTKNSTIDILNKTIGELKAKSCEISENMDVIKSENISLQKNLENCHKTEEELQKSLKQAEADKQNMLRLLSTEQKQTENFQLEITELKNQVNDMEDHFKAKDLTILDLTKSIECHKAKLSDMDEIISASNSEKACLENSLKDCALREKSLQNDLQIFESDRLNLSEQLTAEKERSEELQLLASELTEKVDSQQADLSLKETTIDDQNKNIGELKIKVHNLTEDIASVRSEKLIIENELNEMTLKVESLQKKLLQMENEKDKINEHLTAEKSKSETLELNLAETKLKLDSFHDELDSKNMNMELINKKLEEFKYHEDHLQDLESQLVVLREKEISLNEKINQLEEEKTATLESLSTEKNKNLALQANISEFQVIVANLESELKTTNENFSSLTSDIAQSKETYELKLQEFETALEVMKSQNDNLSNQIKDFIETETALKETMKRIEAEKENMSENLLCEIKKAEDLQISIEELKTNLSTRESEICDRDKIICNLKTEVEDLRRTYEEEKHNLVIHIGDIKDNLLSIQDSVKSIYSENDLIQSDMSNLKQECQELLMQKACAQQSREEFLFSLLNQLGVIEKHVEALEENYEEKISVLNTALWNAELKIALQVEDYAIVMNEKNQLQSELISNQENIHKKEMELKRALILKAEHLNCLKGIEDLKDTQEHLCQENYQLQATISDLRSQLWSAELKNALQSEDYDILMSENTKVKEQLKSVEESILENEKVLKNVALIENELVNCRKIIEDSKSTHEHMSQKHQVEISDLTQKMEEISMIADERIEEIGMLNNEKSKLLEELKTTLDLLQEKETELADVTLLVKEHINCSENIKNLMEAKENLTQENHQLHVEISDLTQKMEEIAGERIEEIGMLNNEKSKLLEELKTIQDLLQEKETELADVTLLVKEHINCSENVKNLMEAKENLTQENHQLHVRTSDLTQKMDEISLIADERIEEIGMLNNEKSKLLEKLKSAQDLLQEKETELADVTLLVKEHINCSENVKNLMEAKENLTQENHQLHKQVFNLQTGLSEAESKIVHQNEECSTHLQEKFNLLNELKVVQKQLCDKETALENAILIESEHINCHKIIENLANTNKILTEKNDELQEQIFDLKKILSEADTKSSIQKEELEILAEEKFSLLEELKVIKENLCSKERDCGNLTATKINLCEEKTSLLAEISSVSQDLHIAKERLSFLDNKLKDILLKCKDVVSSIKDHRVQKDEISLDLMNTMSSYGLIENKVVSQGQQMENMCDLVCRCLELLEESTLVQSLKLEIPIQVAEIGNLYFQAKDVKASNNCITYYDGNVNQFPTDCQNLQTNIAKDLTVLSIDVYTLLCSFEDRVLNQKDKFKFLMHHQLIECTDLKKMLLALKFMKNVYSKICCRKFALQELKDIKMCLLSQNQSPQKMASVLSSLSSVFKEDNDVNLFFEKNLLVNAYKNIYMAHRLKKALYFVKDQLNMYSGKFEKYESYFNTYQNIHNHPSHMPILTQSKFKIYLNGFSSFGCKGELKGELSCLTKNKEPLFSMNSILYNVKASTVPLILNCMFEFYENNFSSSVYKNLVYLITRMLQSCCLKEVSFLASNTVKTVDNFLLSVSLGNSSAFKNIVLRNQMNALGDLVSSLLGDLSSIKHLVFSGEQELQKNRNVLSEVSDQLNKLKFDHECKQRELDLLQALLQEEKDKQQNLPMLTKNDCNILLSQKEKLEKTVLEISKLCSVLKNIFSENCDVLNLQTEVATLSDTFCICQSCLNTLEKSKEEQCNHVLFSPVTLIHFIAELFNSKSDLEKEVVKLEECRSIIKHDIMKLENDKSLLQQTIDDLEGNVNTLEHELGNFKSKYSVLENEYQNINSLYIESNKVKEDQQNCLKANMEEIRNCKRQYEGLLTEYQKVKNDLVEKEEEISNYKKIIQNKTSQYETLDIKCKNYESEIENLNATLTKLTDMKQKESEEINNSLIKEMKNKIASLEKSNSLLNMTVETVEEELQTVYEEKQNIQKELQEKLDEVENLQHEIASWKNKVAEENNEVSCLEHTVQKLTKEVEDTETKCAELLNKNSKLQSDVTLLEQNIKDYEKGIIERDSSIKENSRIVSQLREEILVISNEKKNLQINIEETESHLKLELQKRDTLLYDSEKKLNQILKEKTDLEKQISCLLISEEERKKILLEKESSELKCKELIEEIALLRSKLESFELQAIADKKEKEKAFQSIQNLNFENEKCTKKLEKLKNELSEVKKSNIESSILIQQLQKELDSLKEYESTHIAKGSTLSDTLQVRTLTECKCKGNCSVSELTATKSEYDYKQYMTEIINVFITVIKDRECGDENHKTDLISMLSKWESNIKNPTYFNEMKLKFQSVLDFQFGKLEELELELYNLKDLICKLTTKLNQYCEGTERKVKYNVNMLANKSCFEETLCVSPAKHQSYFVCNSYVEDIKSSFKMLELYFKSMENTIINKDLEINSLKERCPDKVKGEMKTMQNDQKEDYLIMKNKCKLVISNSYRLEKECKKLKQINEELEGRIKILEQEKLELNAEKDCKKLKQTNEELEGRIKILEQENLELNAEADEMAEIIKQRNFSEELENLYRKVYELSDELSKVKEKNKCLRAILEQYQDVLKEHGINISAAQNLAQDTNALQ